MTPVFQTLFVKEHGTGNCMNACVASVLDLNLDDCMDVLPHHDGVWFLNWKKWFKERGLQIYVCSTLAPPEGYSIVSVKTERRYPEGHKRAGEAISHACVALNGEIVHDPFPDAQGLYTICHFYSITPLDPLDDDDW